MKGKQNNVEKVALGIFKKALGREKEAAKKEIEWIDKVVESYSERKRFLEQVLTVKREVLLERVKREFEKNR